MAGTSRTIEFIFAGTDRVSGTIDEIGGGLETIGGGAADLVGPFAEAAEKVLALSAAVGGVGVAILAVRDDFEGASQKINASLEGTEAELDALGGVAERVFAGNFADSISEAADGVIAVQKRFKDLELSLEEVEFATTSAFSLQDLFGADIDQTLGAARTLMQEFGLSVQESFDFLSSGFQRGLDSSGDFLETITEYGVQFSNGGASAEQFFSVMQTGLQDGINGTDRAADAFKEFRVRIQDGSDTTKDALEQLGFNAEEFGAKMADGSVTAVEAFQQVIERLRETDDSSVQLQAGVGLLGTQFEDLGTKGALALDTTATKMEELGGATEKTLTQYETLGNAITGVFRTVLAEIADDDSLDDLESQLISFFEKLGDKIPEVFENLDFSGVVDSVQDLLGDVSGLLGDIDFSDADDIAGAVQEIINAVESLIDVTGGIAEAWGPAFSAFSEAIKWFNELDAGSKELIGNILGISQQAAIVAGGIVAAGTAIAGAGAAMSGFASVAGGVASAIGVLVSPATGFAALAGWASYSAGTIINEFVPGVDKAAEGTIAWIDSIIDFSGTKGKANEAIEETVAGIRKEIEAQRELREERAKIDDSLTDFFGEVDYAADTEAAKDRLNKLRSELAESGVLKLGVELEQETLAAVDASLEDFFQDGVKTEVLTVPDQVSAEETKQFILEILPDGTKSYIQVGMDPDSESIDATKKAIEEAVPPEKRMRIETDLQIAQLEAQAAQVEAALQYKAEVDVAEIEAAAEIITTLAEGAADAFTDTGEIIRDSLGLLAGLGDSLEDTRTRWAIEEQLEKENELRERALKIQEELARAQKEYMEAKAEMLERGDALITVQADGLEPHLRSIWMEIVRLVQIEATAEGAEFLLGI